MPITISGDGTITGAFDVVSPGTVAYFGMTTPPTGWVKANGAALSRTTYSALFARIGTVFGAGDGSTTFNVPDLRGEFPRGWDDGRGVDSGRAFGAAQGDAIRNITGTLNQTRAAINSGAGAFSTTSGTGAALTGTNTTIQQSITFDASTQVPTASENRPRNIALLACIKF